MVANVASSDTQIHAITQSSPQHSHPLILTKPIPLTLFPVNRRSLIIPIFEDVQRYGLKSYHLRKHLNRVQRFYDHTIDRLELGRDLISKYKTRFERYKDSLFTFIEHDSVSWNNNAAERAIRHLAVQRKISGAFTTKGANHYLRLLAIAQSCRFQEKSFLGFLLSGLNCVDSYREIRSRRRGRARKLQIPKADESPDK